MNDERSFANGGGPATGSHVYGQGPSDSGSAGFDIRSETSWSLTGVTRPPLF
jgi:hypothetical protein